ncbi:MAG: ubiquinol-cytochrome c reductase iron-sulfur subunit [Gammaproteobacteria bacterium]|nr:ubiquinol-cytochrome c reductase iron-sulfur subunit [Gammaproteobacteria bacterium]
MIDRRTLLTRIVAGFSLLGLAGFSVPFIRSWLPAFKNETILDVDVGGMVAGDIKVVRWLGRNVMVVRRDRTEVQRLIASDALNDPDSLLSHQPDYAANNFRSRKPEHLLVYANCTHLGCEVDFTAVDGLAGFSCPCHRSEYDIAGRVEKGAAAKLNLEVPEYEYIGRTMIRLRKG